MSRLLAIRPGGVGDCILSFPAIEHLRRRCTYLEVWVPRAVVPLVRFADRVRAISSTGLDLLGIPGVRADSGFLRGFDTIVSWYGTNREEFRALDFPFEFLPAVPPVGSTIHAADFFSSQEGVVPRIDVGEVLARDFVAIHPFSGSERKNWPLERFDQVARGFNVEWCATPEQARRMGARTPLLAVDDLFAVERWLASARAYIGNDSGITHLAAAVGTPVVALFGASSDARVWAPRGSGVTTLQDATVDEAIAALATAARTRSHR